MSLRAVGGAVNGASGARLRAAYGAVDGGRIAFGGWCRGVKRRGADGAMSYTARGWRVACWRLVAACPDTMSKDAMKGLSRLLAIGWWMGALPFCVPLNAAGQTSAPQSKPAEARGATVTGPSAMQPAPWAAPQITIPLVKPRPLTLDPPALQNGKPAPPGGVNDAAARCEAQADMQVRAQCRDKLAREIPVRPPG
jgi:hypothetical protein